MSGSGADAVTFRNRYSETISLAWMRRDFACAPPEEGGIPFVIRGWKVLRPGASATIPNPTENRWFYIFAESVDGRLWTGPFVFTVSLSAFNRCAGLGASAGEDVGFLELDTREHDTFNLVL
jgi:hypothetical protein